MDLVISPVASTLNDDSIRLKLTELHQDFLIRKRTMAHIRYIGTNYRIFHVDYD